MARSGFTRRASPFMSLPIFYFEPGGDAPGGRVKLTGEDARHLSRSTRAKVGDRLLVGDGRGTLCRATIASVQKNEVLALMEAPVRVEKEVPAITVYQAVSRPSSMDEAVYRAAEAGVDIVVPFISARSGVGAASAAGERVSRWAKIARESSKVARRAWQLGVNEPLAGPPSADELGGHELAVVLWEDEREAALSSVLPEGPPSTVAIVTGPEGGFSTDETLSMVRDGAVAVGLGSLVLRAETAGAYAAMLVRYSYGLLGARGRITDE